MSPTSQPTATEAPERILVVRLGAVGDVVRTLPAVGLLRQTWPQASIAWAVEEGAAPLLAGHPDIDRLLLLERRAITRAMRSASLRSFSLLRSFVSSMKDFSPQLSLDFQSSFKSGVVAWLSGAKRRVGFDRSCDREHSHLFANCQLRLRNPRVHRVLRAAELARAAGAADGDLVAKLALRKEELHEGRRHLRQLSPERTPVLLAPFSSKRQAWKRYPLDRWGAIALGLAKRGYGVVVLGGPGEREEAQALCAEGGAHVRECCDLDLRQLGALISAAPLLVGGDTGPMHLAWAGGARVVAIYGPTDPVLNAPFGEGHALLAPQHPTRREDDDRFPGITPKLVLSHVSRIMREIES